MNKNPLQRFPAFSVGVPLFVLNLLMLLSISPVFAQTQTIAQVQMGTSGTQTFDSLHEVGNTEEALQRPVSLQLEEVTLEQALQEVAQQGRLGLSYSPSLIPAQKRVTLHLKKGTVAEALRRLFSDTDLDVLISPKEEIVVVQKQESRSQNGSGSSLRSEAAVRNVRARGLVPVTQVQQVVSGRVTDAQAGGPVPGVNVVVPNTTVGTATDANGEYSLEVPSDADSLSFSAVGYQTQRVAIEGRSEINVQLMPDVAALDEVVVVGYGTQNQAEVTGSVSSVSSSDVENLSVESFQEAIQGKLAGLEIRQTSGEPGSSPQVRLRGTNSITAGNGPLYVIDGLPISQNEDIQGGIARRRGSFQPPSQNPLATVNTNDIESIEVLKDASAAAIYGSRGSNGVVIVETKSGRNDGETRVRYSGSVGMQRAMNVPDMMNSEELVDYAIEARNNNYEQKYGSPPPNPRTNQGRPSDDADPFVRIPEKYIEYDQGQRSTDTDWLDLTISDGAPTWNSTLSVSGGSDDMSYYLSGNVLRQDGIIEGSAFNRYSLRANLEADPLERMTIGANLNLALSQQDRVSASAPYFARPPGVVYSAMVHAPVIEPFNDEGEPNQLDGQSYLGGGTTSASHPLAIRDAIDEDLDHHRTFGTVFAEYDLSESITARTRFGADLSDYSRSFYRGRTLLYRTLTEPDPYGQSNSARSFNWLTENTLRYGNTFNDVHTLDVVAGFTAQEEQSSFNEVFAQNFPIDAVPTLSGGQVTDGTSRAEEWSLLSGLARVNYDYDSKYLLTTAIRADKSSRFGPENRTGVFPSLSLGWRLAEESFMDGLPQFSTLKLRLSYGQTGNFQIPNYGSTSLLQFSNYVDAGQNVVTGVEPSTLGDPGLTWETTQEYNAGLDIGLFDDRVNLQADVYRSITSDLLLNVSVPAASGYETVLTNIGEVENTGLELLLDTQNLTGDFSWSTTVNFSTNRNEVTALGPGDAPILSQGAAGIRHITRVGDPIGGYYGYVVDGIYQSEEEIQNAPEDTQAPDPAPGDFRFKDVDGNGRITPDDRTVTGSYHPDFTYGITNQFEYSGVSLRVFLQGVQGRDILNLTSRHMKNGEANFNSYAIFNERWRSPDNPGNGNVPRADRQTGLHGNNNRPSSFQVEDGSYLNIREVTLGYSLPVSGLGSRTRQIRFYASGQNLYMFTDYLGFNPEASLQTENELTPGQDYGTYPLQRSYTVGIDITF